MKLIKKLRLLGIIILTFVFMGCGTLPTTINKFNPVASVSKNSHNYGIKSTLDQIKQTFLTKTRFTRNTGKPITETKTFEMTENDLIRKFILNVYNGSDSTSRISSAEIKLNSQVIFQEKDFNQNVSDLSVEIKNLKAGTNTIEVNLNSKPGATIDISLDGFLQSIDIPGSIHSKIPNDSDTRQMPINKGKVGIKFLEGMKVRLIENSDGTQKLVDLNGTSLTLLNNFMSKLGVKNIYRPIWVSPEILDQDEIKAEQLFKVDVPNENLFYDYNINPEMEIWQIVDELRKLPFIEEASPDFVIKAPSYCQSSSGLNPNDCQLVRNDMPDNKLRSNSDWLKRIHVMDNRDYSTANPTIMSSYDSDRGAWSITTGDPSIKMSSIDGGLLSSQSNNQRTHEDFVRANFNQ